ncbi:prolyl oligopeptidase family serine peptidase [Dermatophilaceae bacterium Soc4.6]
MTTTAPYGSWVSPITADLLTTSGVGLSDVTVDGSDVYWLEQRPTEGGREALVRLRGTVSQEVLPGDVGVRTMVHEYGGGAYDVRDGVIVFSTASDGRLHLVDGDGIRALTPDLPGRQLRYGDLQLDLARRRVVCVREDHRGGGEAVSTLVAVPLDGAPTAGLVLVGGHDFVASPRVSPDGEQLAWVTWEHPDMPWDSTVLWCGDAHGGDARVVDGAAGVSVGDVGWLADGRLMYASDRSGFWNLTIDGAPVHSVDRDCSDPAWVLGERTWVELPDGRILLREWRDARAQLVLVAPGGDAVDVAVSLVSTSRPSWSGGGVVMVARRERDAVAVVRVEPDGGRMTVLRSGADVPVEQAYLPQAQAVTWSDPRGRDVHGFLYRPRNPGFTGPAGELPPLVVQTHGGPTGHAIPALDLDHAYWTSRGVAVLDVNYGGSTAYGRAYRDRLRGQWGVVDVDDCCAGARAMAERGEADPARTAISGGSAGGYTTLAALTFRDVFTAGVSLYGIGDLETLVRDTHKFESRYADRLVGPYPEARALYVERSPVHHVDRLDCAMLLLHGADDAVVPPGQATSMAEAVRAKGKPVAVRIFAGEGHGFRAAQTRRAATEAQLSFYGQVFGFEPADEIRGQPVDNL